MRRFNAWASCWLALTICYVTILGGHAGAQVLVEDFNDNKIDSTVWVGGIVSSGPQLAEESCQLEMTLPGTSIGDPFGVALMSKFLLRGDFDIRVDYHLLAWPYGNGVRIGLSATSDNGVERVSLGSQNDHPWAPREVYATDFYDGPQGFTETSDMDGSLRLVRSGSTLIGYRYESGQWSLIHAGPGPDFDVPVLLHSWSHDWAFMDWDVALAFDNFVVTDGHLVWPPTNVETRTWGRIKALFR